MPLSQLHVEALELFPPDALPADQFIARLRAARVIAPDDPLLREWSYAPWVTGSFTHDGQAFEVTLFLGGLGHLTSASGSRTHFLLGPPAP